VTFSNPAADAVQAVLILAMLGFVLSHALGLKSQRAVAGRRSFGNAFNLPTRDRPLDPVIIAGAFAVADVATVVSGQGSWSVGVILGGLLVVAIMQTRHVGPVIEQLVGLAALVIAVEQLFHGAGPACGSADLTTRSIVGLGVLVFLVSVILIRLVLAPVRAATARGLPVSFMSLFACKCSGPAGEWW
jgi:hypothetical protein